ncbi:MAG: hypothetical protein GY856_54420, partial [bacterium]|nr:hypothetical protein [bacterium]
APYRTDAIRLVLWSMSFPADTFNPLRLAEVKVRTQPVVADPAWTDTAPDGYHDYAVSAVNQYGFESDPSAAVEVGVGDVLPPPAVTLSAAVIDFHVELSWTESIAPDLARYDVYRDDAKLGSRFAGTPRTFTDYARPNGTYDYYVRAVDEAGNIGPPSNVVTVEVAVPPPAAPINLVVTVPAIPGALDLTWEPAPGAQPVAYRIRRSTVSGGPWAEVAVIWACESEEEEDP